MTEPRTSREALLEQAGRFLREFARRIQRDTNGWSTYQQAIVDCAIGLDALRKEPK